MSGDATEWRDEHVDKYPQTARDYRISGTQKLQFLQTILSKVAKQFYINVVAPHAATFQQAINHLSAKYSSPVWWSRVKNYMNSLSVKKWVTKGTELLEKLSSVYKTILSMAPQWPIWNRGEVRKIELLKAAVVTCE